MTDRPPVDSLSFEKAMEELESIVKRLESGRVSLDDAIETYERGAALRRHCERKLAEAQARIDRIAVGPDGVVTTEPLDAQR